jgi:hypothetical protein
MTHPSNFLDRIDEMAKHILAQNPGPVAPYRLLWDVLRRPTADPELADNILTNLTHDVDGDHRLHQADRELDRQTLMI